MTQVFRFIGVSTAGSSIHRLFPRWMAILDRDVELVGVDVPVDAEPARYREVIATLRDDPDGVGALVTTHKVAVLEHAGDLFDQLDPWARLTGEVSAISKRESGLVGHAKDVLTSGRALAEFVEDGYWRRHPSAGVVCLGAGGAGVAIAVHLLRAADRPASIVLTARRPDRVAEVRRILADVDEAGIASVERVRSEPDSDAIVAAMAPGSLIVNATGAGKDRPGSPISDDVRFPVDALAWDLNYRGELRFLEQARAQLPDEQVHDGWRYFIHGWAEIIGEVLDEGITPRRFAALEAAAEAQRASG